jgi:hypothetical protein
MTARTTVSTTHIPECGPRLQDKSLQLEADINHAKTPDFTDSNCNAETGLQTQEGIAR